MDLGTVYVTFLFVAIIAAAAETIWSWITGKPMQNVAVEPPQPFIYRVLQAVMLVSGTFFIGLLTASAWGIGPERTPLFPASLGVALGCLVLGSIVKRRR